MACVNTVLAGLVPTHERRKPMEPQSASRTRKLAALKLATVEPLPREKTPSAMSGVTIQPVHWNCIYGGTVIVRDLPPRENITVGDPLAPWWLDSVRGTTVKPVHG
ncbi:arginine deiminase [Anopheles sinensis]|uniref:Arginine deiminase n=1 Tax=Anopheles sinensis TaxID=74873 RepID=A0A084WJA5_ANOSI|nr:arginine deiminase [Anopheles sinensis]